MFFKNFKQLKQKKSEEKKELINNLLAIFITIIAIFVFYFVDYYFYWPQKSTKTPLINPTPSSTSPSFTPWAESPFRSNFPTLHKPVIYLYPESKTDVKVTLDYDGEIIADYPVYDKKEKWWDVIAYPDSTIINKADNKEYSYLFWEWIPREKINWDLSTWFVIKWADTRKFLQEILPKMWLTPKEYNEFIVYWYPIMQGNAYNLIHFAWKQYIDSAPLGTEPKFDSMLRVFMVVKPLDKPINIEPQKFERFEREWFTIVEWGGTILK